MSDEQRRALQQEWISAVDAFLERAPDEEARKVLEFITTNGVPARATPNGITTLDRVWTEHWFLLLNVLPGDEANSQHVRGFLSHTAAAQFTPEKRLMILQSTQEYTPTWKALLFLHEGRHAFSLITSPIDNHNKALVAREERNTHAYQNRLVSKFAGKKYLELIEHEAKRQMRHITRMGGRPGTLFLSADVPVAALDEFFGPSASESEVSVRRVHLSMHVAFRIIERCWKGDVAEQQARFYQWYADMVRSTTTTT